MRALGRHQQRRRQGVPTFSVVAGEHDAVMRLVRRWAESADLTIAEASDDHTTDAISCWFTKLVDTRNLTAASYEWLARRTEYAANELSFGLPRRSAAEQHLFLQRTFGDRPGSPADSFCRAVIEYSCERHSMPNGLWNKVQAAFDGDLCGVFGGAMEMLGAAFTPVLYVRVSPKASIDKLRSLLDRLAVWVGASPQLCVVLSIDRARLDEYLAGTPECRALALVREGIILLGAAGGLPFDMNSELRASADGPGLAMNSQRDADDPARSAAERYLYERLQMHPETAGLFELNGRLEAEGNGRSLEVDLLARGVRVAVEIDGYYHFSDLDAYRRDRRKDALLQHAGYFVVRCLADDVASRLEDILESILAAVRRPPTGQGRGPDKKPKP